MEKKTDMTTMRQEHSREASYWGDNGEWFIAIAMHRDSDALARSNFRVMEKVLRALPEVKDWAVDDSPIQTEESNHWAVGWVRYLIVNPECKSAVAKAEEMRASLEDYPVLCDMDFSQEENDEANETWKNCYRPQERIEYIRKHRSQFEFNSFSDLLGCVRGNYFAGYASELIS